MSSSNALVAVSPSWRVAAGLAVATAGYLVVLVGIALYAWGEIHGVYGVPVLAIPIVGIAAVVAGGALVRAERSSE